MALSNTQYDSIIRNYEKTQTKNRRLTEERTAQVFSQVDGYQELSKSIASISVSCGKKLLAGDDRALEELHQILGELSKAKEALLVQAGYPADYLSPIYDCPDCKDTGYIGTAKCHCFKQAIIDLLYEQSGIRDVLERENFSTLSYEYQQGEDLLRFQKTVAACKQFIKTFNSDYHNLFFYGTVGTGKSFLSNCIAKELIESGHSVIYFTSAGLFDILSQNRFDYRNKAELQNCYNDIYDCDLLIIDDLGTEYTSPSFPSLLFSLLNERHLKEKATLISTNLSLEDIMNRYSDRIFSRISDNYTICRFTGSDTRLTKKILQNRK